MPQTIDEVEFAKRLTFDVSRPHDPKSGIAMKSIPHFEFPKMLYRHPNQPYRRVIHRNAQHEVVHEELVATEHATKLVASHEEQEVAMADGWVLQPYIPAPEKDPDDGLYETDVVEVRPAKVKKAQ